MDEGHCGLPTEELTPLAVELLEVPGELIRTELDLELADRTVIADTVGETPCMFLADLYRAEQGIAERILRLANGKLPWPSERFGWTFAPGDKVMQIENDYDKDVYNGDIGYIDGVDPDTGELTARFDGRAITYGFGELDTLVPAYAATIHKSQGSEYPAVVIPVLTQHNAMLQRNLLYTGVSRGKRLVVLVGQKKAVAIAVRNVSGRRRWSKLNEWLAVSAV